MTRLTNSELQTFKRCRRKWWLAHVRRLAPRVPQVTGSLALGDRVHQALLARYQGRSWDAALRDVYDQDRVRFEAVAALVEADEGSTFVEDQLKQLDDENALAFLMLEGYEQWVAEEGIDADLEVYDVECALEVPLLPDEGVTILGKLDQRAGRPWDGARLFRDFKTVGNLAEPAKTLPRDEQGLTYMCLEHADAAARGADADDGRRFDAALFTLLRKVKRTARATPPFYGQLEVRHSLHELRRFWRRLKEEARELLRLRARLDAGEDPAIVAYPSPRRDCHYDCPFYVACPMFDNGEDAEGFLEERFEERDPLERYGFAEEVIA